MTDEFPLYLFFVGFFLLAVIVVALVGWVRKDRHLRKTNSRAGGARWSES